MRVTVSHFSYGVLKRAKVAVWGMCCTGLNSNALKVLGNNFSYIWKLKDGEK